MAGEDLHKLMSPLSVECAVCSECDRSNRHFLCIVLQNAAVRDVHQQALPLIDQQMVASLHKISSYVSVGSAQT